MSELSKRLRAHAQRIFDLCGEHTDDSRDLLAAADALEATEEALDTATLYGDCATFRVRRNRALERIRGTLLPAPPEVKP